ncbi:astacin, partial [Ancylostoma duodenale]
HEPAFFSEQANEIVQDAEDDGSNRTKRQAFRDWRYPRTLWSKGVNYFFDPSASSAVRRVFTKAARLWMKDTCIDFRVNRAEYTSIPAPDRIRVFREDGCWSYVGSLNRQQDLSLGDGCESVGAFVGTAAHEIGHAIGFFHTQSRHDRDNFITFNVQNVKVMAIFFRRKRCDPNRSAKCAMGGFPHPRDCSRCICPSGYGGRLCNERPSGCGRVYQATAQYQTFTDEVGNRNAGQRPREDMDMCNYWITAPAGSMIEVKLVGFPRGLAVDGCQFAGVEIKTHADQRLTGYSCAALIRTRKFCESKVFSNTIKRAICPKSCGFC